MEDQLRQIILDIGNGSAHGNDKNLICKTIDEVARLQDKTDRYEFTVKTQIWSDDNERISKELVSTSWDAFECGYNHSAKRGIKFTTSVFDQYSLDRLLCCFEVPFVKFACRDWLYDLIPDSENIKSVVSVSNWNDYGHMKENGHVPLICVARYPSNPLDYIRLIEPCEEFDILDPWVDGISDHTCDWGIFNRYHPYWYEVHFSIDKSLINDKVGGTDFVRTPEDIERIL